MAVVTLAAAPAWTQLYATTSPLIVSVRQNPIEIAIEATTPSAGDIGINYPPGEAYRIPVGGSNYAFARPLGTAASAVAIVFQASS